MKRFLTVLFLFFLASPLAGGPGPQDPPCPTTLAACPDEGCGKKSDPHLNRRKNIRSDEQAATLRTLTWMKKLGDPEDYEKGGTREELTALGEGQKITVRAYLLVAKPEGAESCNCGLTSDADTDNHLVLVSKATVSKFPAATTATENKKVFSAREKESITAEFTPRVRVTHPNFTRAKMRPLINATAKKALLVRVTGLLMFDSEHFFGKSLVRVNDWEIHPILKLEFCTTGETCKASDDAGWQSIDD